LQKTIYTPKCASALSNEQHLKRKGNLVQRLLPLAEKAAVLLKAHKQTIAVAESSAGGLINASLLALPGASAYCKGGMVMYTRDALLSLRNMNNGMLDGMRASSEPYALLKARVIREHLGADWGLSESGAAGPTGNKYGDNAGHVVLAVSGRIEKSRTLEFASCDRQANMYAFAQAALTLLVECLESSK
jgi:nicotinamide-nucleotide amidase